MDTPDHLLTDLTPTQRAAVTHPAGPLLIIAGAGTGKTTVLTRRIAWLIATQRARPEEILALTFTDKAAAEMEERVDVLLPYGTLAVEISTFHAFGDRLLRAHGVDTGLGPGARVLSKAEQTAFLRAHLFELPLKLFRPSHDPLRYVDALSTLLARAKDEAVTPEAFLAFADSLPELSDDAQRRRAAQYQELARCYAVYQELLRHAQAIDFGDQVLLAVRLLERHPHLREPYHRQLRYVLVDEFQDTNFAQFRLLQLLAPADAHVTVVADDDQSIYKWRGAAISNVLKFLEHYRQVHRVVLTENFRSTQAILDCAYRLIRRNDPDRLEVTEQINKRLVAMRPEPGPEPTLAVFDTGSSEADWVARQIDAQVRSGARRPGDFAILVRTNREADLFLRALNVCGIPWQFSGSASLFGKESAKLLRSCLQVLADPEHSLSWYHVLSSELYAAPMADLIACLAQANRQRASLRAVLEQAGRPDDQAPPLSPEGEPIVARLLTDVSRLMELSRTLSPGQLLYRWLTDTGWLKRLAALERPGDVEELQTIAQFFDQLHRMEGIVGNRLPELMQSLELFQALADGAEGTDPSSGDRVSVLTIHKAKGLEFPVVFLVGLVHGRFPTPQRRDPIELPEALINDLLPAGNYHLQEERRLFYVGMTRAKDELYLTAAFHYGGRSTRKLSPFILEALPAPEAPPAVVSASPGERIARAAPPPAEPTSAPTPLLGEPLRLDAHGLDDYVTCPLKFRYSHVLRIPILRHHLVIYGAALHKAIEEFFKTKLRGQALTEQDLLAAFEQAWSSEGFMSQAHEEMRLRQGRQTLQRFFAAQQQAPELPALIEEPFRFMLDDFLVVGRLDRVDRTPEGVVIADYKSSEVDEPAKANQRARESLQLAVYALAWHTIHGELPIRVELRFLETGLTGSASPTLEGLERTRELLRTTAKEIRAMRFLPQPQEVTCRWCAYQPICPFSA